MSRVLEQTGDPRALDRVEASLFYLPVKKLFQEYKLLEYQPHGLG